MAASHAGMVQCMWRLRLGTELPMDSYTTVADGIYATAPTNSFTDDSATNAVHFYRIQLKE